MKKTVLFLLFILLAGILFSGCTSDNNIPKGNIIQGNSNNESGTDNKEIDSLFEEELENLPDENLNELENELI